jgi:leucyl-tRNA synthetase
MQDFSPDGSGRSPLARLPEFLNTTCPRCGGPAQRETDTMGGFACSSWYFLRFTSPHYEQGPFEPEAMQAWMPVDLYVGGAEHAVLHLLYARFWTKAMADLGLLPFREPFARLMNQGQLLAPDGQRMSKSRGNTITPDSMVASYGADALRLYELFMAPFDQDIAWSPDGISGSRRFLNRIWSLYRETYAEASRGEAEDAELKRSLHRTIRRATERIESFRFNTLVSTLMEFTNTLLERQHTGEWRTGTFFESLEALLRLLAPVAPHIAEEIWTLTGHSGSIHQQSWPEYDPVLAAEDVVEVPVQVDGKLRAIIQANANDEEDTVKETALNEAKVKQFTQGREVVKVVYVPGKVVNVVTKATKEQITP